MQHICIILGLLKDIPNPELFLAGVPSYDDITKVRVIKLNSIPITNLLNFIKVKNFVKEVASVLNEMKIENNDELVVPFII